MSLIHTCRLCGVDPLDYLTQLHRHAADLTLNPAGWMPWNYREMLDAATTPARTSAGAAPNPAATPSATTHS